MMGKTHAVTGAVAFLAVAPLLPLEGRQVAAGCALAAGAALLPDIDHPSSTAARSLGPVSRAAAHGIRKLTGGHRHATHSLLGLAGFVLLAVLATQWAGHARVLVPAAVGIGAAAHLVGDSLTPGGVPWLWPAPRRYALPLVTTGNWAETLVRAGAYVALAVLAVNTAGAWPWLAAGWEYIA